LKQAVPQSRAKDVPMEKLLIIEDSREIREQLRWGLGKEYEVYLAGCRTEALPLFRKHLPRVVTLDLGLPPDEEGSKEGMCCIEEIFRAAPATKIIVITGNSDREIAFRAVQSGAYDYYAKPLHIDELKVMLKRAYYLAAIEADNHRLLSAIETDNVGLIGIIGQSRLMQEVFATIRKVASSDVAVLVTGESGTGKELVARALHGLSLRRNEALIPINCGAIPENLLESELFGYEKGAFSGAHARNPGRVEYAHKGTLFLDEIGELPLGLQVKLLRFLQEKTIQRVGGREEIPVDARIIAATNLDISQATEQGTFREDLYYRIAVIHINLPALRERGDDVLLLANLFLRRFSRQFGKKVRGFSTAAIKLLKAYDWPGNVRELENNVQRAVIMSESPLLDVDVFNCSRRPDKDLLAVTAGMTLKDAREKVERELILSSIEKQGGNMAKTAEKLGISRPTLYDLVKKYGIGHASNAQHSQEMPSSD
jgi:two-component system, NtrC family, response regulator